MPTLVNPRHLPNGWMFAIIADTWIIGVIDSFRTFARNQTNVTLALELDPADRQKRFIAIGVRKADVSYDAGTGIITLADPLHVQGEGFDTLKPALQRVRQAIIDLEGVDVGNLTKARCFLKAMQSRTLEAAS